MNIGSVHIRVFAALVCAALVAFGQLAAFAVPCLCTPTPEGTTSLNQAGTCCTVADASCCALHSSSNTETPVGASPLQDTAESVCSCLPESPVFLVAAAHDSPTGPEITTLGGALAQPGLASSTALAVPRAMPGYPPAGTHLLQCSFRC